MREEATESASVKKRKRARGKKKEKVTADAIVPEGELFVISTEPSEAPEEEEEPQAEENQEGAQ